MTQIKIDKRVPMPLHPRQKYPIKDMKVGDSFFVPDRAPRSGLYCIAKRYGMEITVRNEGEGVRVWRTK